MQLKLLAAINVAQLVLIIVLLGRVTAVEQNATAAVAEATYPTDEVLLQTEKIVSRSVASSATDAMGEDQLRRIVREELAAVLVQLPAQQYANAAVADGEAVANVSQTEDQDAYQRETVRSDIDYYTSKGSISAAEMATLQSQIAQLDKAGRTQMLRELTQALNSSDLQGHF